MELLRQIYFKSSFGLTLVFGLSFLSLVGCGQSGGSDSQNLSAASITGTWALTKINENDVAPGEAPVVEIKANEIQNKVDSCNGNLIAVPLEDRVFFAGVNTVPGCFVEFTTEAQLRREQVKEVLEETPSPRIEFSEQGLQIVGETTRLEFKPQ